MQAIVITIVDSNINTPIIKDGENISNQFQLIMLNNFNINNDACNDMIATNSIIVINILIHLHFFIQLLL